MRYAFNPDHQGGRAAGSSECLIEVKVRATDVPYLTARDYRSRRSTMASAASLLHDRPHRVGILVARSQRRMMLSPFFSKCDGLLVVDPGARTRVFRANAKRTGLSTCDLVLSSGIAKLVCGFIARPDLDRLSTAGIDVRIGSCARTVDALVRGFDALPAA